MTIDKPALPTALRAVFAPLLAGLLSGLGMTVMHWMPLKRWDPLFMLVGDFPPITPTLFFTAALCWFFIDIRERPLAGLWMIVAIYGAWWAGLSAAIALYHHNDYLLSGFGGGAAGAFCTFLAAAIVTPRLRNLWRGVAVTLTGMVAGLTLPLFGEPKTNGPLDSWKMFAIWQASVLLALAFRWNIFHNRRQPA